MFRAQHSLTSTPNPLVCYPGKAEFFHSRGSAVRGVSSHRLTRVKKCFTVNLRHREQMKAEAQRKVTCPESHSQ